MILNLFFYSKGCFDSQFANSLKRNLVISAFALVLFLSQSIVLMAATLTVTNTSNSGVGSLRQAIIDANSNSDLDTIEFAISGAGPHRITPTDRLPHIDNPVVIDGYTQLGAVTATETVPATLLIELDGSTAGGNGLYIREAQVKVRGIVINNFGTHGIAISFNANSTVIEGNYIGTNVQGNIGLGNGGSGISISSSDNIIGGTTPAARNIISDNTWRGIQIIGSNATGNQIRGNYIGTDVTGTLPLGNSNIGVFIDGADNNTVGGTTASERNVISDNQNFGVWIEGDTGMATATGNQIIGNYIGTDVTGNTSIGNRNGGLIIRYAVNNVVGGTSPGTGNLISGNIGDGVTIWQPEATGNQILGNYIGTNAAGMSDMGNTASGISIVNLASNNTIGGTAPGAGNLISGNDGSGIYLDAINNKIMGNYIGTDATGNAVIGNDDHGVYIGGSASSNNTVGDTTPGAGNLISGNQGDGIQIRGSNAIDNKIVGNTIFSNIGLGIDIEADDVTANDVGDGDVGANNLQNFPVLTSMTTGGSSTTIAGTLNSTSNTNFHIEFFANTVCDPSGFGEGEILLGSDNVMTDGMGDASFTITLPVAVSPGHAITATATDSQGNTSEFSECFSEITPTIVDLSVLKTDDSDPVESGQVLTYTVAITNNDDQDQAEGVTLTDTLPNEVEFVSASTTQGSCTEAAGTVICDIGAMPEGDEVEVTIEVDVSGTSEIITNTATVTTTSNDPDPSNNTDTEDTSVQSPEPSIEKTIDFFDQAVEEDTITGSSGWIWGQIQLNIMRQLLTRARFSIERGYIGAACWQLRRAYLGCDGEGYDWVVGEDAGELAQMIYDLAVSLDCWWTRN